MEPDMEPSMLEVVMDALGYYEVQRIRRQGTHKIYIGKPEPGGPYETRDEAHTALMRMLDS